ncbi:MAG: PEP/pyruvate-binding domain-containing protein [Verrucomicrobiales bacterium]
MTFVFWPENASTAGDIGGKALALWSLRDSGLSVPAWFAVLPSAFAASVPDSLRQSLHRDLADAEADLLGDDLTGVTPSREVAVELAAAVARRAPAGEWLAVRSSAVDEDGIATSFAGQYESLLAVRPDQVLEAVATVWRSAFSSRVSAYRRARGLPAKLSVPAVLVQRLVRADSSGVVFGADPVSGRRDRLVVSAVPGFGIGLVQGETDADTWHLDADGHVLSRKIARKPAAWRLGDGALSQQPLSEKDGGRATLTDTQLAELAGVTRTAGRHFGSPQDVEWAIENGTIHIVQSRPITTLSNRPIDDAPVAIWDNSNIVESYSGVTTPLTFSFAQRAYEGVYRQFCRLLAVPAARIEASDQVFRGMLGLHQGRIYYNLLNWYRVLALLPGFTVNRRFMEQMMGVKEPMPTDVVATLESAGSGARIRDGLRLALSTVTLVVHHWRLPAMIRRFRTRLDEALSSQDTALDQQHSGTLASSFLDLERRLLRRWDAPLINDFLTMIFFGVLRDLTARWSGQTDAMLHNDLLSDGGGMLSAEPARLIANLAGLATAISELPALLMHGDRAAIDAAIDHAPTLRTGIDAYLARFGERCFDELKLESSTLLDNPLPLYRAIGRLASKPASTADYTPTPTSATPRTTAEKRMARTLAGHPIRTLVFRWVLHRARTGVRDRENLRLERTRLFGRVRHLLRALGRRFHEAGALDHPDDVFFLEIDEVLNHVSGTGSSVQLRALADLRRKEFQAYRRAAPPPNRFTTHGIPSAHRPVSDVESTGASATHSAAESSATTSDERRGLGCCPGKVRGRVCVVTDPAQTGVRPGDILVAERTDPGWVLLFPCAAGLLVERGSLLSHSAIVARELRLPAIVSIIGLMSWLRDGDHVEFDGASGVVRRLSSARTISAGPPSISSILVAD